jgi:hypothetical protein
MAKSGETFADQILAGLAGGLATLEPEIPAIAERNRKYRQSWALVEVSCGEAHVSSFVSRWPEWDADDVLSDPEVVELVEEISRRSDLQTLAQQRLAGKALGAALEIMSVRLDASDCGIHHARDVAELALKIEGAAAKSPKAVAARRMRTMSLLGGVATVVSPEYPNGTQVAVRCVEDVCGLFVAMRCVNESEFHAVWDCLKESLFVGSLTLEGW